MNPLLGEGTQSVDIRTNWALNQSIITDDKPRASLFTSWKAVQLETASNQAGGWKRRLFLPAQWCWLLFFIVDVAKVYPLMLPWLFVLPSILDFFCWLLVTEIDEVLCCCFIATVHTDSLSLPATLMKIWEDIIICNKPQTSLRQTKKGVFPCHCLVCHCCLWLQMGLKCISGSLNQFTSP